uniref:Uncharacterized protein n=1 Tax=Compsopogon caeruleus TaxID=31354 RepID=A0A7S1TFJ3_9RHOD|mmetsp:Transcript_3870/g.7404  ORF Transcript_3870/g.7404 Transcript_3870/m.7404 type:complete len:234 (+) Transcript_3870:235-936(+)
MPIGFIPSAMIGRRLLAVLRASHLWRHDGNRRLPVLWNGPRRRRHLYPRLQLIESTTDGMSWDEEDGFENVFVSVEDLDLPDESLVHSIESDAHSLWNTSVTFVEAAARRPHAEVSVVLSSDAFIQRLNRQWRGLDHPTDVLSFPQGEDDQDLLGDLIISVETAHRQAQERNHSDRDEIRILLVHGLLHLLGYDHEVNQLQFDQMRAMEHQLLKSLRWTGTGLIDASQESTRV